MLKDILLVGMGGFAGSVLRYLAGKFLNGDFPWGTFVVNISGCLLIGILYGLFERGDVAAPEARLLMTAGFCGGYTTFSAFMNENLLMLRGGEFLSFALYTSGSILVGLAAVWFGYWIVRPS